MEIGMGYSDFEKYTSDDLYEFMAGQDSLQSVIDYIRQGQGTYEDSIITAEKWLTDAVAHAQVLVSLREDGFDTDVVPEAWDQVLEEEGWGHLFFWEDLDLEDQIAIMAKVEARVRECDGVMDEEWLDNVVQELGSIIRTYVKETDQEEGVDS